MKKFLSSILVLILVFSLTVPSLAKGSSQDGLGSLVIIGGALDPENSEVYNKIIELSGVDPSAVKIAIIPAASSTPVKSGNSYKSDFVDLYGVPEDNVKIFPIASKDDSSTEDVDESTWKNNGFDQDLANEILNYQVIFFTGGDQLRITSTLLDSEGNDSPVLSAIREVYSNGGVIAGTSAGAAIMSDPMIGGGSSFGSLIQGITYEDNYDDPDDNRVFLTRGLGFFDKGLIDQHFIKRGRFGRLITACLNTSVSIGYGIDENTAMVVTGDEIEVVGESGIMIVDTSNATKSYYKTQIKASNIKMHYLETGDKYNINTKEFTINQEKDTTIGYEYYTGNSLNSDIFGEDSVVKTITYDLVDNTMDEAIGVAFDVDGTGVKLIFNKDENTEGFWGKINGKETYAAVNVNLDIVPIKVRIKEIGANTPSRPVYSIQDGDTLANIANRFSMNIHHLIEINGIKNPNLIFVGQQLYLSE